MAMNLDPWRGVLGIFFLIGILFLFSEKRRAIRWKTVGIALAIQSGLALLVHRVDFFREAFSWVSGFFVVVLGFTKAGSLFLFGSLVERVDSFGFIFVFQVLPNIVFFAALSSLFYYLGILQKIVWLFAWVMRKGLQISGAESLSASANIFLGQTEAPLLVRPYIMGMTRSELLALMVGGMATIAGSVLAAYVGFLGGGDPAQQQVFATHLLCASMMAAPAGILAAKILVPETEVVNQKLELNQEQTGTNVLEAIANGTTDGLRLAVNVGAMLLVFTAMMAMVNHVLQFGIGEWTGWNQRIALETGGRQTALTMQYILGVVFAPLAWLLGIGSKDMVLVGQLLGEKVILNEFFAYTTLTQFKVSAALQDPKSVVIATYALCGFANFASIGIQIGGIGALAPERRGMLSQLGLKALLGGTIASLLNATMAGLLLP
jgi:CNT family concentrative nucleoside transporter